MKLEKLDFGAPAAERDIRHGFKNYFVESESYRRFKNGKKSILLGNRGSGKSAIFKMLADTYRLKGFNVIELTPDDYSYEMLSQTMTAEAGGSWVKQGAYAAGWKYLIYILAMKKILERSPSLKKKDAKAIFNYLRDNHKGIEKNPLDILLSYLKRIEGVKLSGFGEASLRVRGLQSLYRLEEINHLLPMLEMICRRSPVIVFVDELDRGWDASEDAKGFVAGLFQAATSINNTMQNFQVLISLRQELYDNIPSLYEDAQKVWDLIEVIKWDKTSLMSLIAQRIKHSLKELEHKKPAECWRTVFSRAEGRAELFSFDYLVERTLYRPREIIQFCTQAKEQALGHQAIKINLHNIEAVELNYSEHRTKDIAAEYRFQYPGLIQVFEAFRGRPAAYTGTELEELCIQIILHEIPTGKETTWFEDQEPEYLIMVLWQVGFLRAYTAGAKISGNGEKSFLGIHQISTVNLKSVEKFDVHPMFRAYLGIV